MPGLFDQKTVAMDNGDVNDRVADLKSVVDKLKNMKPTDSNLNNASAVLDRCQASIERVMKETPADKATDAPVESSPNSPSSRGL